jgi:hypothetical protein
MFLINAGSLPLCSSAIVLGSLVPLAMFLSWEVVALSLLPSGLAESAAASSGNAPLLQASLQLAASGDAASGAAAAVAVAAAGGAAVPAVPAVAAGATAAAIAVDPLEVFVRRSSPVLGSVVEAFAFLAVMTSFIGTTLSLSGALDECCLSHWGALLQGTPPACLLCGAATSLPPVEHCCVLWLCACSGGIGRLMCVQHAAAGGALPLRKEAEENKTETCSYPYPLYSPPPACRNAAHRGAAPAARGVQAAAPAERRRGAS